MSTTRTISEISSLQDLYDVLPARNYEPLWTMQGALTPRPTTQMTPTVWRYDEVRELIVRAGALISAEDADRRVLAFKNPGCQAHEVARSTDTLWAAIQLVLPGEVAPAHRHTAAALRYIIEGEGAYTVVEGERIEMERGDFLITPNWTWHEHGHGSGEEMIWLDGLDVPMLHAFHAIFAEFEGASPAARNPATPALRSGALKPLGDAALDAPTLVWKLADVEEAIDSLRGGDGDPHDDLILEYRDPATNGPVTSTMSAAMQLLRAGVTTSPHRHTHSVVYHAVRGSGVSTIDGEQIEWGEGDTFALPIWSEHHHENPGGEDAMLFSFSDEPAIASLGLRRSEG